jgi:hypothetical protein
MYSIFIFMHLIPLIVAGVSFKYRNQLSVAAKISLFSFVVTYSFVMYGALATDFYLNHKLQQFDLNGDGFFSGNEVTPEQELAMKKLISDTGRTLAPFTGIILSTFLSVILFLIMKLGFYVYPHLTKRSRSV